MALRQRISLRKHETDITGWVGQGRSDEWISSALGTTASSVQSFRSRRGIYRQAVSSAPATPERYSAFEGVVECEKAVWFAPEVADDGAYRSNWRGVGKVKMHLTPERIVISRR